MSGNSESDESEKTDMEWEVQKTRKKRLRDSYSSAEITEIIGATPSATKNQEDENVNKKKQKHLSQKTTANTSTSDKNQQMLQINSTQFSQDGTQTNQNTTNSNPLNTSNKKNYSQIMQTIMNKKYKHMYYVNTTQELTRIQFSDIWSKYLENSTENIIKTKKGFIIKSDNDQELIKNTLKDMKIKNIITDFSETTDTVRGTQQIPPCTYAGVIATVEYEITDDEINDHLKNINITHRFCKRITARSTGQKTRLIRIITGCINSFQKLLNEGLFYKNKHYPVYPSSPPAPLPVPCTKCTQFDHTTENCNNSIKCTKCQGAHHTNNCKTSLPPRCAACNADDHAAWSTRCPKRPVQPIEGIPNTKIKKLNKMSHELDKAVTKNNRIHSNITIHDHIITTYINKVNKPKNTNRVELINKLKRRFIEQFEIDTSVVFTGNRIYILMFDLKQPNSGTPTEPLKEAQQYTHNIRA